MITKNQLQFVKDLPNKKITVIRQFDAPVDQVWKAWTQSDLLEQWWAPKPFRAQTKSMDFKPGGQWLYAMVGPNDEKHWCKVEFTSINAKKSFEVLNMFCDENGNPNREMPSMQWKNEFSATSDGTKVTVTIVFDKREDLEKIIEMGFEEGFTAALGNLDEVLAH
jgi:PhnB protein